MQGVNIVGVRLNHHFPMYGDLIRSLQAAMGRLELACSVSDNALRPGLVNILVGSTVFAARHHGLARKLRGLPYIVYQLEQLDDSRGLLPQYPEYWDLLTEAVSVWDYAPASTAYLLGRGLSRVTHLPPAHDPSLESFTPTPSPEWDVVFCGSPHPRRLRLLQGLRERGVKLLNLTQTYGADRDRCLASAKIVLNIHAWDGLNGLETVRLSHLLANGCFVISETGDHNPYGDGLVYADYDALASTCLDYLSRPSQERAAIAAKGYEAIRRTEMAELLRPILAEVMAAG